ncbi:hypothetical protein AMECASPLE_018439 [Ameca splendens]|uniref:Uncharacterized protein n=1 Tax=Ameca splendens TaxID=208324 RepID=A0ABV0XFR9_9TELE
MSDKDYIPNSESAKSEDSDVGIPLQSIKTKDGQIQGNPTLPDLTLFLPVSSDVVVPSTSKYQPLLTQITWVMAHLKHPAKPSLSKTQMINQNLKRSFTNRNPHSRLWVLKTTALYVENHRAK